MSAVEPYLEALRDGDATDLHLRAGEPPYWRVGGELVPNGDPLPDGREFEGILDEIALAARVEEYLHTGDFDFVFQALGARFRAEIFDSEEGRGVVIRRAPAQVPLPGELGLPEPISRLADETSGIALLCGAAACGKSTTMASLLEAINVRHARYIMTVESRIDHLIRPRLSLVHQTQVGRDTPSHERGILAAMRAGADVLGIGELLEPEAVRLALDAADRGALVLAAVRASDAVSGLERVLELLPREDRDLYRGVLATNLRMVTSQVLIPTPRDGLVPATEIVRGTRPVQALVREGRAHEIAGLMTGGRGAGMRSLDDSLEELVAAHQIDRAEALRRASSRTRLGQKTAS